jgi:hypothetical protein
VIWLPVRDTLAGAAGLLSKPSIQPLRRPLRNIAAAWEAASQSGRPRPG